MAIFKGEPTKSRQGKTDTGSLFFIVEKKFKSILTEENWYPTINGRVDIYLAIYKTKAIVSAWGGDDYTLCKHFSDEDYAQKAKALFEKLIDFTTQKTMEALGMSYDGL